MRTSGAILAAGVLAAALAALMTQTFAQSPAAAIPPTRVAVCDVGAVFNGYLKRNDLNLQLEQRRKQAKAEDKRRLDQITKIEKTLKQLKRGTPEYDQQAKKLQSLVIEARVWREFTEKAFRAEHRGMMETLYREILAAVAQVAKARNIDLVLYSEEVQIASKTTPELYSKIAQRKCLYHKPAIDLTKAVLDRLNRQYSARRGK
ncbi:MAG: hypothetical protein B1H04_00165 [Planctomycetales bacterium 4484_123]|nr:MAG: hypothetical protein B1H04_00165 [Planctomycetales bacterium 4484_123]